jgi:hypothetical protein
VFIEVSTPTWVEDNRLAVSCASKFVAWTDSGPLASGRSDDRGS